MIKMVKKYDVTDLFKVNGHLELLRLVPKSAGFVAYLPRSVVEALNLRESDRSLVCFIDDSSSYTTLIIFRDKDLSDLLKSEILSRRQRAEELQRQLKAQQQSEKEAKQVEDYV